MMKRFWSEFKQGLYDVFHPTFRVPNPVYYWRRWRAGVPRD